jgi:hypothetical protein
MCESQELKNVLVRHSSCKRKQCFIVWQLYKFKERGRIADQHVRATYQTRLPLLQRQAILRQGIKIFPTKFRSPVLRCTSPATP